MADLRGIAWPFVFRGGKIMHAELNIDIDEVQLIKNNLVHNLMISISERLGSAESGGNARALVFENFSPQFEDTVRIFLLAGIIKEMPQVLVHGIEFKQVEGRVQVSIEFAVSGMISTETVVFDEEGVIL